MWPKAISMIANGDLPMEKIISHVFPLQDFKKGIDMVSYGFIIFLTLTSSHTILGSFRQRKCQSNAYSREMK